MSKTKGNWRIGVVAIQRVVSLTVDNGEGVDEGVEDSLLEDPKVQPQK